jgi:DNA-binding IclR family transcriptional regulator
MGDLVNREGSTSRSARAVAVLACIKANPGIALRGIIDATGLTYTYVRRFLQYERLKGVIDTEQVGDDHRNYLAIKTVPAIGPSINAVVEVAVCKNGDATIADLQESTRYSRKTISRALHALYDSRRVTFTVHANNQRRWRITPQGTDHAKEAR